MKNPTIYPYPTIVQEDKDQPGTWHVYAQDGSLPVSLHSGSEDECHTWQSQHCKKFN